MSANSMQVGGDHYRASVQHWDVVEDYGVAYLEGCASKYVTRWRKKGTPIQDLEKAAHFTQKAIELAMRRHNPKVNRAFVNPRVLAEFMDANNLSQLERAAITRLFGWNNAADLGDALHCINQLLEEARATQTA